MPLEDTIISAIGPSAPVFVGLLGIIFIFMKNQEAQVQLFIKSMDANKNDLIKVIENNNEIISKFSESINNLKNTNDKVEDTLKDNTAVLTEVKENMRLICTTPKRR